ncbi:MAG: AIPR family protein [Limnohabitans sp.]|nr:AIPR family protein [Limnohabitans sp.]
MNNLDLGINDIDFREEIEENLNLLKERLDIDKDEYAFHYWILSNLYQLDVETCKDNITEYNDKGIDCFVHFEENKELYIIQNKYYSEDTPLASKDVSDFLTRPISTLKAGNYTKSKELQTIFNSIKEDKDYKIFLHFYITNNKKIEDIENIIRNHNNDDFIFELFYLNDIKKKYYGDSYKETKTLKVSFDVINKGVYLAIRPAYGLKMPPTYYVMTRVTDVYKLWKDAKDKNYTLFEKNIREYLGGTSGINKGIINTLKDKNERSRFFYYNNGITIICDDAKADASKVEIENPQIVNGCQTVNSISEVLKNDTNRNENYKDVFVIVKILVLSEKDDKFYKDIVKYANSQNSINEKVFGAAEPFFIRIRDNLKNYGILLIVKQSDKYTFKKTYRGNLEESRKLLENANKNKEFYEFKSIDDLMINLETLIQIIGAVKKDAYFAYTKKSYLLKPTSKYYEDFSMKIESYFTGEGMLKLVLLYKKCELDKKESKEGKEKHSPYYFLNFLAYYLTQQKIDHQVFFKNITIKNLIIVYEHFRLLPDLYYLYYYQEKGIEHNQMLKQKIDEDILKKILRNHLINIERYTKEKYNLLMKVFKDIQEKNKT